MVVGRMATSEGAYHYLELTLEERNAARNSTTLKAREYHEELAIAYEIRCLLSPRPAASPDDLQLP